MTKQTDNSARVFKCSKCGAVGNFDAFGTFLETGESVCKDCEELQ